MLPLVTQLPSVALCARFTHSLRSFTSLAHPSPTSFVRSLRSLLSCLSLAHFSLRSLHSLTSFVRFTRSSLTHFVRSLFALASLELIARLTRLLAHFVRWLRSLCALKLSIINSINWFCTLRSCISLYTISRAEADCRMTPFACTITFLLFVCAISTYQKIFP